MEKLALVTGGAHRLGKSFALTLARLGYDIVLHYHSAVEEARQTQGELESLNCRVILAPADLTQPAEIQSLVSNLFFSVQPRLREVLQHLDVVKLLAGAGAMLLDPSGHLT